METITANDFDFGADEIELRKQRIRDLWAGKPLDHTPVWLSVANPAVRYSTGEQFRDGDKQLYETMTMAGLTWRYVPDGDVVPAMRVDVGCSCLATAFGSKLYWGYESDQTCGVKEPILKDVEQAYDLKVPLPDAGQLGEGIERIGRLADAGSGLVSVSLLDMAGGLNVVNDLLGPEKMYMSMYDNPAALKCLLDKIQQLFLATIELQIEAAGGEERITTTDFPQYWFPEGRKGHVSDDISANIPLEMYQQFSLPYHNMIFENYGGGGLHNCGPNPCLEGYLSQSPAIRAIDLSYPYSKNDFPVIKKYCRKRAIIYLMDFPTEPQEAIDTYREIMEFMTPDVVVIPDLCVSINDDPGKLNREMREISREYALKMDWGWDDDSCLHNANIK